MDRDGGRREEVGVQRWVGQPSSPSLRGLGAWRCAMPCTSCFANWHVSNNTCIARFDIANRINICLESDECLSPYGSNYDQYASGSVQAPISD
jgi:hypothetical protein